MLQRIISDTAGTFLCVLLLASSLLLSDSATPHLDISPDSQCACLGSILKYTCTAVGGGSTLWTGTAFDCTNNLNRVNLRHSVFNSSDRTAIGGCNNGDIVGRSIGVMDNCYTSELSVTVSAALNNETIRCDHRSGTVTNTIGQSTLIVITAPLPPPDDVRPIRLLQGNLTLQWTSVTPACSSKLDYRISSTNCGNCVLNSNSTSAPSATCSDIPLPMTACSISVQSVVCGDQVGELSRPVDIMLKVPGVPHVNILPVYSLSGRASAAKIMITNNQTISYPYGDFIVPVTSYRLSFIDSTSGVMFNSTNTSSCAADDEVCEYLPDVSSYCHSTGSTSITVSAANELGSGLSSDPIPVECTNNLVEVTYRTDSSTIICTFYDPQNIAGKLCTVVYGKCNSQQLQQTLNGSSTPASPNIVMLQLQSIDSNRMYCYSVTANNDSYTVIVMGRIGMDGSNSGLVIAVVIVLLALLAITSAVVIIIIIFFRRRKKRTNREIPVCELSEYDDDHRDIQTSLQQSNNTQHDRIQHELQLRPVEVGRFEMLHVDDDYQLREFLLDRNYRFEGGCAYYEFTHEEEHISENKQLIFMRRKGMKLFSPSVDYKILKKNNFIGEKILRPKSKRYRLFVQSTSGSGARHLPAGSMLLYDCRVNSQETIAPSLRPLFSDHFELTRVDSKCTLNQFCTKHGIKTNKINVFLDLDVSERKGKIRDIILVNKHATTELFTGPSARIALADSHTLQELQEEWMVFVIEDIRFKGDLSLKKGSFVLHEISREKSETFHVLKVERNNVQMSTFIEENQLDFENGRAFYEFTGEEDLDYYKEVVKVPRKKILNCGKLSQQPDVSMFYSLPGTPGLAIQPPNSPDFIVFIQSISYGSRCLKAGTTILYKMSDESDDGPEHRP